MLSCRAGVEEKATYTYLLPPAPSTVPVEHTKKRKVCALSPEDTNYCFCKSNAEQRETFSETQEQSLQILTFYSVTMNTSESLYLFFWFMLS